MTGGSVKRPKFTLKSFLVCLCSHIHHNPSCTFAVLFLWPLSVFPSLFTFLGMTSFSPSSVHGLSKLLHTDCYISLNIWLYPYFIYFPKFHSVVLSLLCMYWATVHSFVPGDMTIMSITSDFASHVQVIELAHLLLAGLAGDFMWQLLSAIPCLSLCWFALWLS